MRSIHLPNGESQIKTSQKFQTYQGKFPQIFNKENSN